MTQLVKKGDGETMNNDVTLNAYTSKCAPHREHINCDLGVIRCSVGSKGFSISSHGPENEQVFFGLK